MNKVRFYKSDCTGDESVFIQSAIDECAQNGQELVFEPGTYITTALDIPSGSRITLKKGAVLKANEDYKAWERCTLRPLVSAFGAENIVIQGEGEICCSGEEYHDEMGKALWLSRPRSTVSFRDCKDVTLRGIRVTQSVSWTVHFDNCEQVLIDSVTIRNPEYNKSNCCDGIDINGCRYVEVSNCDIETADDAICLKNFDKKSNGKPRIPMHSIYIHDCTLATTCNGFKIGTETVGDIFDVRVENITLNRHSQSADTGYPEGAGIPLSAVNIQSNDGASVHDISVKNFHATIAGTPIFMVLQKRETITEDKNAGSLYNIEVENLRVDYCLRPSLLNCCEGRMIENVTLKNIRSHNYENYSGVCKAIQACGRCYPDPYNYGHFPAYGLFAYNVENLDMQDVEFTQESESNRDCIIVK